MGSRRLFRVRPAMKNLRAGSIDSGLPTSGADGGAQDVPHQTAGESSLCTVDAETRNVADSFVVVPERTQQPPSNVSALMQKYGGQFEHINSPLYPHCDIYLCGTMHVANSSIDMVRDVIQSTLPDYVVLELCEERIDTLQPVEDDLATNTFAKVLRLSWERRCLKTLCLELFALMQNRGAKLLGSRVGGELAAAAKEAHQIGSVALLGDRLYSVTMQRIQDRLSLRAKITVACMLVWETLTMTFQKMKEFTTPGESNLAFVQREIDHTVKHLPALAEVVIFERDAYLARTIADVATLGFGKLPLAGAPITRKGKVLAVVGAGHLGGIRRHLMSDAVNSTRMQELSRSSAHNATWAGPGMLQVVDLARLYKNNENENVSAGG
eukprot:gene9048-10684_t